MMAGRLARSMGKELIGKNVKTPGMGIYPGGIAKVISLADDPAAPEIVFNVEHPTWKDEEGSNIMGIFDYEDVELVGKGRARV